jgi:hypothetical protein
MKILITEQQNEKLIKKIINDIKSDGLNVAAKRVGGFDIFAKLLNITTPMDFLHLFDDMKISQSDKNPSHILFRYNPNEILMLYNKDLNVIYINYDNIWSFLEDRFGLYYDEIRKYVEAWLDEVYKLKGVIAIDDEMFNGLQGL